MKDIPGCPDFQTPAGEDLGDMIGEICSSIALALAWQESLGCIDASNMGGTKCKSKRCFKSDVYTAIKKKTVCTNLDRPCLQKVGNQSKPCQAVLWKYACMCTYTSTYSKIIFARTVYSLLNRWIHTCLSSLFESSF